MKCDICGHEFTVLEERKLILCTHQDLACLCGTFGFACTHHQLGTAPAGGRRSEVSIETMKMPGGWEMVSVTAGGDALSMSVRRQLP